MRSFSQFSGTISLIVFALIAGACDHTAADKTAHKSSPTPTPPITDDDFSVASHAVTADDVLRMLRHGDSQKAIMAEVKRRRFIGNIVEATEYDLSFAGAGRELVKVLKDKANWVTESQELAYGQLLIQRQAARSRMTPAGPRGPAH